jgi:hypothetical protein
VITNVFPLVDPIPLPAPVWLMKFLGILTTSLHFMAVQLMVGGLLACSLWAIVGRLQRNQPMLDAAGAISFRLPIVMVYLINLGVPPLLFAQVLYGRQIYSSSVLIGTYWIAVIFILMAGYTLLYVMGAMAKKGSTWWGLVGLVALALIMTVGFIYSNNMTLMIRPEAWQAMYEADPLGRQLNTGDPTVLPRWSFMMFGSFMVAGVGMMALGMKKFLSDEAATFLRRWGGALVVLGVVLSAALGRWALAAQPEKVMADMRDINLYNYTLYGWLGTAALLALLGVAGFATAARRSWLVPGLAAVVALLNVSSMAVYRDGLRDVTLLGHGFDVWDRAVHSNWIVIAAFLLLFVAGLGVAAWLGWVVSRAEGVKESYA